MLTQPIPCLRKASIALSLIAVLLVFFTLTLVEAIWCSDQSDHATDRALVRELGLTDLSLFTEARYTRHPSQTDRHTAFQDHPAALEHFPTGSFMRPPHLEAEQ